MFGTLILAWKGYEEIKAQVISFYQLGLEVNDIASQLNLAKGIVEAIISKYREEKPR